MHQFALFVYISSMDWGRYRQQFMGRVAGFDTYQHILDLLPDVAFFIKDRESRIVLLNRRAVESFGIRTEEEALGKQGYEFIDKVLMDLYLEQDQQVMATGKPIIDAICPSPEKGSNQLIVFSKFALRDQHGEVIGLVGIFRDVRGLYAPPPTVGRISRSVELMHERYGEELRIGELASAANMSTSQFRRYFHRLFKMSPQKYLTRVRVNAACRLLAESDRKTSDIAVATGFFDHSHFSRTFRRLTGLTPLGYRRRHAVQ